jgi:hypothetical protein
VLLGLLVDVAELRVPVGMLGALLGLEGALQRVILLTEQPPDRVIADRMPLRGERLSQLAGGLAGPPQRALRVSAGVGVDQVLQRLKQPRVTLDQPLGPAARPADAAARVRLLIQLPHAGVHRRSGQPSDAGHPRATPAAQGTRRRAGQQAALLLGQVRGDQFVQPSQHGVDVHAATLPPWHAPTATIGQTSHAGTPKHHWDQTSGLVSIAVRGVSSISKADPVGDRLRRPSSADRTTTVTGTPAHRSAE